MKASRSTTILAALALGAGIASAQPAPAPQAPGPGGRMDPGMMDRGGPQQYAPGGHGGPGAWGSGYGRGPGMMEGYGRGYGMGPGGPGGWGPGMMMGPGMMGHGMMGHGFMGGPMMGAGGGRALWSLDLDESQRKEVLKLQDEQRRKHWELMGRMHDEMAKLRDAWLTEGKRDRAALSAAHKQMGELRQQAFEASLDAADRLDQILTAEQREQLRRSVGPWWMSDPDE